jgi:hypothetical protein
MDMNARAPRTLWLALAAASLAAACSSKPHITELPQGEKNLRIIFRAYTQAAQQRGRSPKNADELKPFLKDYGNPDELLISPNDGKPYVIVPGVNLKKPQGNPVLAFEQEGKNGKRQYIALGSMSVQTATGEEFARLTIPPGLKTGTGK